MTFRFAHTSCPSYIEQVSDIAPAVYILNCRPVSSIGARRTVIFAMQMTIPAHAHVGANNLTWELAPKTYLPPFTSAALSVEP